MKTLPKDVNKKYSAQIKKQMGKKIETDRTKMPKKKVPEKIAVPSKPQE